jgi:16S rRNA (cytosine967-C5)-methyltransferase
LRWRGRIDHLLDARAPRGLEKLTAPARAALRLGAYQILFSRSVPARAAVNETVRALRALGLEGLTGLANALLRRLDRERDALEFPDPETDPVGHAAAFHAHPPWLVARLQASLGREETRSFLEASNRLPPLTLRARAGRVTRDALITRLSRAGFQGRPGRYAPDAVVLEERAPPASLPGFSDGDFGVQDEASQLVGCLVGARPGERVLDACAAPGGKTVQLAEAVGPSGHVVALDLHPARLSLVERLSTDLGLDQIEARSGDARRPPEEVAGRRFDRVLVDAPCTGLGVLRRNPDARWRARPEDPGRLRELQGEMLAGAFPLVEPEGILVYSVCTFTEEETIAVVEDLLARRPDVVVEGAGTLLGRGCEALLSRERFGEALRTWPHRHGTDGFFAVRLKRRA